MMYRENLNEESLFSLLDAEEQKIVGLQNDFWNGWNEKLRSFFGVDIDIRNYSSVYGGFSLSDDEMRNLDDGQKSFFANNSKLVRDRWILRGYSYYSADPLMYLSGDISSDYDRWEVVMKRWQSYYEVAESSYCHGTIDTLHEWVSWVSLLEYMFNDLTTMYWAPKKLSIDHKLSCGLEAEIQELEIAADNVAKLISELILLNQPIQRSDVVNNLRNITVNALKIMNWDALPLKGSKGYVRAIREADSLPLVYASYLKKLRPWAENTNNPVLLLSNAFGALNVSLILKHLLYHSCVCSSGNIHFSQNRLDNALFGKESEDTDLLCPIDVLSDNLEVVIVDDCIFTGKSYKVIKNHFCRLGYHTKMLPLSIDIQSLKYYRTNEKGMDELINDAEKAIMLAEELNKLPPVFVAFWNWNGKNFIPTENEPDDYVKVMNGGDVLLKTLWQEYKEEILSRYNR